MKNSPFKNKPRKTTLRTKLAPRVAKQPNNGGLQPILAFTIHGELTDLNTYINAERSNRFVGAEIKRRETERVVWEAKAARLPKVTSYPIYITYLWHSKNNRKDIDNVGFSKKFIQDGLVLAGVLEGDGRKHIAGLTDYFFVDSKNPRVEVLIEGVLQAVNQ